VLNQLNLVVRDFDATLAFYRKLGLDVPSDPGHDGIQHTGVTLPTERVNDFETPLRRV